MKPIKTNKEASALAACYRLLLQKAVERRKRLAIEISSEKGEETAVSKENHQDISIETEKEASLI